MATKKVTVKDIANKMGVSLSTVNKALTGKTGISEKRRQEIIDLAEEMGYTVNLAAQMLSRHPMVIGVIMPSDWEEYFASMERGLKAVFDELRDQNVSAQFAYVKNESDIENAFSEFNCNGIKTVIYCSAIKLNDKCFERINELKMHVILADDVCGNVGFVGSVGIDASLSGSMAADFLRLITNEGSEVALFIGSRSLKVHNDKADAFLNRARELGLITVSEYENFDDAQKAYEDIKSAIDTYPNLEGIYIATALAEPIVEYVKSLPEEKRPKIIATDFYDFIGSSLKRGDVSATIFQNQVLVGRLAAKLAYEYTVEINSYNQNKTRGIKRISVTPQLILPSNAERLALDDGNSYTVNIEALK